MAVDAYMAFKNYKNRDGGAYLASESTATWNNTTEALGKPFKAAGTGKVFEVTDYGFDIEQTLNIGSQSTGTGAGRITFNPFSITRSIDISSTTMFLNACAGTPFEFVYLGLRKSSGGDATGAVNVAGQFFVLFTFAMVAVKTITWAHADESPTETITFDYGALQVEYAQQKPDGSLDPTPKNASWNRMTNTNTMPT